MNTRLEEFETLQRAIQACLKERGIRGRLASDKMSLPLKRLRVCWRNNWFEIQISLSNITAMLLGYGKGHDYLQVACRGYNPIYPFRLKAVEIADPQSLPKLARWIKARRRACGRFV